MTPRLLLRAAVSCLAAVSLHAAAQTAPEAITDADIANLQENMESGCVHRGLERQDGEKSVRAFCACMRGLLADKIARADWQRGIASAANGHNEDLEAIVKPHLGELQVCKARQ